MRSLSVLCFAVGLAALATEPAIAQKEGVKIRFFVNATAPVLRDIPKTLEKKQPVAFTLLNAEFQDGFDRDTSLASVKRTDGEAPKAGKCYRYISTAFFDGKEAGIVYLDFFGETKPGTKITEVKQLGSFTADQDGEKGVKRILYEGVVTPK